MNIQNSIQENTFTITGSTGGLAQVVVNFLAKFNANFIFLNRNKEKTESQIKELALLYPNINIEYIPCDLSNFESVKNATHILKQKHIDILYLAAGVYNVKRFKTDIGFDNIFQTNFVSHYYMVKELLTRLNKTNGKIVAVSSIAYNYSTIDDNDIDFSSRKKASRVYGNSKRFLTFGLHELMKNQSSQLSIVHPGVTLTTMTNHYPKAINWLVKLGIKLFFPKIEQASLSLIKGIFENTQPFEWIGPKIFNIWGKPKKQRIKNIPTEEISKIFNIAENIYNNLTKSN